MTNVFKMMKDAVLAQKNLKKIQDELKQKTVQFSSDGGEVTVIACGDASIAGIKINEKAVNPHKTAELEKMVLRAVNGALEEAKKMSAEHMQNMMTDMGLPKIPGLSL